MELEFFYTLVVTLLQPFAEKYAWSYLVCLIVISIATLALWFSFLIFQGFGLYAMAKKFSEKVTQQT